ncbi:MAG: serine/threonine-protein kinase [Gemmataceae bacterium]
MPTPPDNRDRTNERAEITQILSTDSVQLIANENLDRAVLDAPHADGELGWFQHYRVLAKLGEGGMGVVFRAEDTRLGRHVALKVMSPKMAADLVARKRFLREARAMAAIQHEHVVVVYQVGLAKNETLGQEVPFLAMQFLEGETLQERLIRADHLPARDAARIGREIAEGLAAAHAQGLVHRDIKLSNVWLATPDDRVKILDFGLACLLDDNSRLSRSGQIIGSPYFMSPEQALGEPVDPRTDLFSLGCVLYALLAGAVPFEGATLSAVLKKLTSDEPPSLVERMPQTPSRLAGFIRSLMAKSRDNRPASAQDAAAALARIERECNRCGGKSGSSGGTPAAVREADPELPAAASGEPYPKHQREMSTQSAGASRKFRRFIRSIVRLGRR